MNLENELLEVYNFYHKLLNIPKFGRAQALRNMKRKIKEGYTINQFYTSIKHYNDYSKDTQREFIYRCTNFFGMAEYFVDFLEKRKPARVNRKSFNKFKEVSTVTDTLGDVKVDDTLDGLDI